LKDDANTLNGSIYTINKNTAASVVASTEISKEANAEETKYTTMSPDQHAGQIQNVMIGNKASKRVKQFKYLEAILMNQKSTGRN
jgi:hypothetical protein